MVIYNYSQTTRKRAKFGGKGCEKKMRINLPNEVKFILERLNKRGFEGYAVGGCIRDLILNKRPYDWDITTSANPDEILNIFSDFKTADTGLKHGTVTVIMNHKPFEITTYRTEGVYSDNRHPDKVEFSTSISDDLSRRDFTMNAVSYNESDGIYDPFCGINDINNKIIKSIGNPDTRFKEDALRILRGLRFSAVLGFDIEENTAKSMFKNKNLLNNISGERISSEFNKLIIGDNAYNVIKNFRDIIAEFIPEIIPSFEFDQHNPHHCFDVWEHSLIALKKTESDKILRLAIFFHDLGKPYCLKFDSEGIGHFKTHNIKSAEITQAVLKRLKYDAKTLKEVTQLVLHHDDKLKCDRQSVKRYISEYGRETMIKLMKIQLADNSAKKDKNSPRFRAANEILRQVYDITENNECCTVSELKINGNDIIALGVPKSKLIGEILKSLLELVIRGECENSKDTLIKKAEEIWVKKLL